MDELEKIIAGSFDVVPAIQALALRVLAAERDLGKLVVTEPVEDVKSSTTSKQRASGKGGSG
ncbi:MAG: hypothetical protein KDE23_22665 [Caldilinea sp.]|nr:hypothetical protein [Caldilinea sp.]